MGDCKISKVWGPYPHGAASQSDVYLLDSPGLDAVKEKMAESSTGQCSLGEGSIPDFNNCTSFHVI